MLLISVARTWIPCGCEWQMRLSRTHLQTSDPVRMMGYLSQRGEVVYKTCSCTHSHRHLSKGMVQWLDATTVDLTLDCNMKIMQTKQLEHQQQTTLKPLTYEVNNIVHLWKFNVPPGNQRSLHLCGCYFNTYRLLTDCWRPSAPPDDNSTQQHRHCTMLKLRLNILADGCIQKLPIVPHWYPKLWPLQILFFVLIWQLLLHTRGFWCGLVLGNWDNLVDNDIWHVKQNKTKATLW